MIAAVIMALLMSGCIAAIQETEPGAAQPTVEELLADALKYYNAGNYEEAILLYETVIEIEPRNFDATIGLGRSFRGAKRNPQAVEALKAAYELNASANVAYELGCAYIANGQYTDAERLASERWKDGEGDNKAGTVLLLSLAAQEKTEEAIEMLNNEKLAEYLKTANIGDCIYAGSYDENGKRAGHGVGLYPGGYIYIGGYKDGVRCGQGAWYYASGDTKWCFTGEWANDAPNGYGTDRHGTSYQGPWSWVHSGEYIDGLENGARVRESEENGVIFRYTADKGKVPIIGVKEHKGENHTDYVIAYAEGSKKVSLNLHSENELLGISPWNTDAD